MSLWPTPSGEYDYHYEYGYEWLYELFNEYDYEYEYDHDDERMTDDRGRDDGEKFHFQ